MFKINAATRLAATQPPVIPPKIAELLSRYIRDDTRTAQAIYKNAGSIPKAFKQVHSFVYRGLNLDTAVVKQLLSGREVRLKTAPQPLWSWSFDIREAMTFMRADKQFNYGILLRIAPDVSQVVVNFDAVRKAGAKGSSKDLVEVIEIYDQSEVLTMVPKTLTPEMLGAIRLPVVNAQYLNKELGWGLKLSSGKKAVTIALKPEPKILGYA